MFSWTHKPIFLLRWKTSGNPPKTATSESVDKHYGIVYFHVCTSHACVHTHVQKSWSPKTVINLFTMNIDNIQIPLKCAYANCVITQALQKVCISVFEPGHHSFNTHIQPLPSLMFQVSTQIPPLVAVWLSWELLGVQECLRTFIHSYLPMDLLSNFSYPEEELLQ